MATSELSRGKTIFVLTVVAGCFAVLWPKIFYPMFFGSPQFQNNLEKAHGKALLNGCCDVYFEKDIQTLKIITQLCEENVLLNTIANSTRPLSKAAMLNLCYRQLQETCNIDLSNVFKMNQRHELDSSFKQFISIVRTFNSSLCLKYHYNVNFNLLGTPRIINSNVMKPTSLINAKKNENQTDGVKSQLRQERPPHMRPEMLHPALRENGRAIPHEHIVPRVEPDPVPRPVKQPGGPKPGMGRPAFGGGGPHAAKQGGGGIMNLLMPMYTVSIVAFFIYTMLRIWDPMVLFVKLVLQFVSNSSNNARDRNASSTDYYSSSTTELRSTSYYQEEYCATSGGGGKKQLPEPERKPASEPEKPGSKLEDLEMESLRRRLEATEAAMERLVTQMLTTPARLVGPFNIPTVQDGSSAADKSEIPSNDASIASGVISKTPESRQNSILEVEVNNYEDVKQALEKQRAKEESGNDEKAQEKGREKKGVKFEEKDEVDIVGKTEDGGKVPTKKSINFGNHFGEGVEEKANNRNVRFIEEEKAQNNVDRKLDEDSVEEVKKIIEEEIVQRAIEAVNKELEMGNFGDRTTEFVTETGANRTTDAHGIKSDDELIKENIEKISEELQKTIISSEAERTSADFGKGTRFNGHGRDTNEAERLRPADRVDATAVQVIGMDRTESLVGGQKWDLGRHASPPRSVTPEFRPVTPDIPLPAAHRIVLDGLVLPAGADKILVTDTETESSVTDGGDSDSDSVVLSSKVTLSLLPGGAGGPAEEQVRKWMEDQKERKN